MESDDYEYESDYENETGVDDDELLYREMNPDDEWYAGDREPQEQQHPSPTGNYSSNQSSAIPQLIALGILFALIGLFVLIVWLCNL